MAEAATPTGILPPGMRVLVSAAASGIGRAIVDALARQGARIHACDVDDGARAAFAEAHPDIPMERCDVAEEKEVDRWVAGALEHLGGLDALVNNAGIGGPTGRVEEIDPTEWRRTIDVDLNGMFYVTRRAVPALRESGGGAMVNISSLAGRHGFPGRSPYAAAKWAVVGFTKTLARELGDDGIRVNAIQPGFVEGPRIDRVVEAKAAMLGRTPDEIRADVASVVSLRRFVSAQDVADSVLYFLSPLARNVSGQVLAVDGDTQMLI